MEGLINQAGLTALVVFGILFVVFIILIGRPDVAFGMSFAVSIVVLVMMVFAGTGFHLEPVEEEESAVQLITEEEEEGLYLTVEEFETLKELLKVEEE